MLKTGSVRFAWWRMARRKKLSFILFLTFTFQTLKRAVGRWFIGLFTAMLVRAEVLSWWFFHCYLKGVLSLLVCSAFHEQFKNKCFNPWKMFVRYRMFRKRHSQMRSIEGSLRMCLQPQLPREVWPQRPEDTCSPISSQEWNTKPTFGETSFLSLSIYCIDIKLQLS